jgi:hypothetical protein
MVKSDDHMALVKEQLLYEQRQLEATDTRRRDREAKKFSKEVAAERRKDKAQQKKAAISGVTAMRKQRAATGFQGELDVMAEVERMEGSGRGGGRAKPGGPVGRKPATPSGQRFQARDISKKRTSRDSKFGESCMHIPSPSVIHFAVDLLVLFLFGGGGLLLSRDFAFSACYTFILFCGQPRIPLFLPFLLNRIRGTQASGQAERRSVGSQRGRHETQRCQERRSPERRCRWQEWKRRKAGPAGQI